jgi:small-conductance mechanosensitive channel
MPYENISYAISSQLGSNNISITDDQLFVAIVSLVVALVFFVTGRIIIQRKLRDLKGSQKILGMITIGIIVGEFMFLGTSLGLFMLAIEVMASIGVGFGLIVIALQNYVKSMIAGIHNYLSPEINIGDVVEISGKIGVIIELHLLKTVLMAEDGRRIIIPNLKFNEDITIISHKKRRSNLFDYISK